MGSKSTSYALTVPSAPFVMFGALKPRQLLEYCEFRVETSLIRSARLSASHIWAQISKRPLQQLDKRGFSILVIINCSGHYLQF